MSVDCQGLHMQVMVAACDTFRSGAVEQLKTHCVRLGAPLYERGYEKDPAKVAFEAQRAAAKAGCDVLLVDTAGLYTVCCNLHDAPCVDHLSANFGKGNGAPCTTIKRPAA